jgi:hypothetical protein
MSKTLRARKAMRRRTRKSMRKSTRKSMRRRTGKQRVGGVGDETGNTNGTGQTPVETGNTNGTGQTPVETGNTNGTGQPSDGNGQTSNNPRTTLTSRFSKALKDTAANAANAVTKTAKMTAENVKNYLKPTMVQNVKVGGKVIVTADNKIITSKHDTNYDKYLMPTEFNSFDIYFDKGNPELANHYNSYLTPKNDHMKLKTEYKGSQLVDIITYLLYKRLANINPTYEPFDDLEPNFAANILTKLLKNAKDDENVKSICETDRTKFIEKLMDKFITLKSEDATKICISINGSTWINENRFQYDDPDVRRHLKVDSPLRFLITTNKVEPNKVEPNKVEPNKVEPNKVEVITFPTDNPNDMFTNYINHLDIKYFSEIKLTEKTEEKYRIPSESNILGQCAVNTNLQLKKEYDAAMARNAMLAALPSDAARLAAQRRDGFL